MFPGNEFWMDLKYHQIINNNKVYVSRNKNPNPANSLLCFVSSSWFIGAGAKSSKSKTSNIGEENEVRNRVTNTGFMTCL